MQESEGNSFTFESEGKKVKECEGSGNCAIYFIFYITFLILCYYFFNVPTYHFLWQSEKNVLSYGLRPLNLPPLAPPVIYIFGIVHL